MLPLSRSANLILWLGMIVGVAWTAQSSAADSPPKAAQRPARLPGHQTLYNGDCTYLFTDTYAKTPNEKFDKKVIHDYINRLADYGVDTYLANTNAQVPWYPSKRTRNILTGYRRGDKNFVRGHFRPGLAPERLEVAMATDSRMLDRYLDLQDAGVDWLAEVSKVCRQRGVSPWFSIRMNDMHGANSWEKSYMNSDLQRDPKFRLSGRDPNPKLGANRMQQPLDYSHREVRDYMLLQMREVVEDYDFEGLELDWLRCPFCCEVPATQANLDMMTGWIREIRALTQKRAAQTGKPYPLGLRLPCRLGLLKAIGLDVAEWTRAGLIDFVGFSNFWQTSWDVPYEDLRRELGDKVAIYGVIEDAPNWIFARDESGKNSSYRLLSASPELLRGNAAGKLVQGVDGIEFFNFFCTDEDHHNPAARDRQANYAAIQNIADLPSLRGQPKHYTLASSTGGFTFPFWEYAEQIPVSVEPEQKRVFRLTMAAEPADKDLELEVQVVTDRTETEPQLGISFNGSWPRYDATPTDRLLFPTGIYTRHAENHRAFNVRFPVSKIRDGWNEVTVFNGRKESKTPQEQALATCRIVSVELAVKRASQNAKPLSR